MNKTSPTAAGPTERQSHPTQSTKAQSHRAESHTAQHIDTINQVFALFRVNYHNQYYAALNNAEVLNQTKKLWADSLAKFAPSTILAATKKVIEESEYLPTLKKMLEYCRGSNSDYGLPDVRQAYVEACHAGSPKTNHPWTHPAVYFAGRDSDWYFLSNSSEAQAFPVFKQHYERWCEKVKAGGKLPDISLTALPETTSVPLDKETNQRQLQKLREQLNI